jgi:putative ABC transport system ATP-binding protein
LITGEPRNATVVANDNLDTYVLGKGDFRAAIDASASFRDQLYRVYFVRH